MQMAVDRAAYMIQTSQDDFEAAANELLRATQDNADDATSVKVYIQGCRYACTGNLQWR